MKKLYLPLLLVLGILLITSPLFASVDGQGIPSDAHIFYGADFTNPAIAKTVNELSTKLKNTKEFSLLLKKISDKSGIKVTTSILDIIPKIAGVNAGMIIDNTNPNNPPTLMLITKFKTAGDAIQVSKMIEEKLSKEMADNIAVGSLTIGNYKLVSLDRVKNPSIRKLKRFFKKLTLDYIVVGNSIALYVIPKKEGKVRDIILSNVKKSIESISNNKATIVNNAEYIDLLKRTDPTSPFILFVSNSLIQLVNKNSKDKIPPVVNYIGMVTKPENNLEKVKTVILAVLKDLDKDPALKSMLPIVRTVLKSGNSAMDSLPADTVLSIGISLNISKELRAMPPIAQNIANMKKKNIDLEKLLLNWFDGEMAIAVSKYAIPSDKELKNKVFNMPDIYISLKTKDGKATLAALDQLFKTSPMPIVPVDSTVNGMAVKVIPLPIAPPNIKGLSLQYAVLGNFLVITSTKSAMEKAVNVVKTKKSLLNSPYYKDCINEKGIFDLYMNTEELLKMSKLVKKLNPRAKVENLPGFQKAFGANLVLTTDTLRLSIGSKTDFETTINSIIKKLKSKFKIKK